MPIDVIGAVTGVAPTSYLGGADAVASAGTVAAPAGGPGFATALTGSIDQLQGLQSTADELAVRAVTGDLDDVHDYTIAASEAKVTLELTAAVRNKAVEAFTEIMRMQA
ncbi:flagellar hook-basal body complex protein FliE [Cellulomonas fimi]|uniref:Flagellar hook-basal body complex protein FliE n=1 Tax=Cellulomonas fimi TaxID=1708 RepID=A0A7Y0LZH1_CELFI|nr:flagellar hook-basal body complex protein FliE [Cellulomonas fimi]NMR21038.1 flagellar hook-basal body complex protein FliE [Cellulomonas fimi]